MDKSSIMILLLAFVLTFGYGQQDRKGLAVLSFQVEGEAPASAGKVVADLITNRIKLDQYFIVERARLSDIIKEKLISAGDMITEQEVRGLQSLGVSYVMIGHISKIEGKYYGGYRIVDVNNARIGESDAIVDAKDFSDFVDKTFFSLIGKEFIKAKEYEVVKKGWLEQYKQNIESRVKDVENKLNERIVVKGEYTGDDTDGRIIHLGFEPKAVFWQFKVDDGGGVMINVEKAGFGLNQFNSIAIYQGTHCNDGPYIVITNSGFRVESSVNRQGIEYVYVALK